MVEAASGEATACAAGGEAAGGEVADREHEAVRAVDGGMRFGVVQRPHATGAMARDAAVEVGGHHGIRVVARQVQEAAPVAARDDGKVVLEDCDTQACLPTIWMAA